MSAGSVGLQFVLSSAAKALASQPFTSFTMPPATPAQQKFGLNRSPRRIARIFYINLGFGILGMASDYAPRETIDDSDIVLRRILLAVDEMALLLSEKVSKGFDDRSFKDRSLNGEEKCLVWVSP